MSQSWLFQVSLPDKWWVLQNAGLDFPYSQSFPTREFSFVPVFLSTLVMSDISFAGPSLTVFLWDPFFSYLIFIWCPLDFYSTLFPFKHFITYPSLQVCFINIHCIFYFFNPFLSLNFWIPGCFACLKIFTFV